MSYSIEGQQCPVCHAYLFEEDDVVFCPECGAPHHRDCYKFLGHCGLEQFHGTAEEYRRPEPEKKQIPDEEPPKTEGENVCPMCGEPLKSGSRVCENCGAVQFSPFGGLGQVSVYSPFDPLGGIPADMDLGGIKAEEAQKFVATNTRYYIPKFARMLTGQKASWNWLAFFFPSAWLLSRKMYKLGAIACAVFVALNLFAFPLSQTLLQYDFSSATNFAEYSAMVAEHLPQIGNLVFGAALVGSLLQLVLRILLSVFGDWLYRNHTLSSVKKIKNSSEDATEAFARLGGINFYAMLLGVVLERYLPTILTMFM